MTDDASSEPIARMERSGYSTVMAYVLFLMICSIWSGSFLLMKKASLVFSPISVGAWRVAGGAAVLLMLWMWRRQPFGWRRRDVWSLAWIVFAGYAWPYCIQAWLVARNGSAFIGMTVSFTPLFTMLASVPLLKVIPHPRQAAGVFGALCGLGLLMSEGFSRQIPAFDLLLAVTVPLGYALVNTWIRRELTHVSPLTMSLVSMSIASLILQPMSWYVPSPIPARADAFWPAVVSLAVLGIVGTGLAMFWFNKLIHERGPLFAGMVTNLVPAGAVVWGWCDGEDVTLRQLIALAIILPMAALVQFGGRREATFKADDLRSETVIPVVE